MDTQSPWLDKIVDIDVIDWVMLYSPVGARILWDYFEHICLVNMAWLAAHLRNAVFQRMRGIYSLPINPTKENLKHIHKIQQRLSTSEREHGYEYACCSGIFGIGSNLHTETGEAIR